MNLWKMALRNIGRNRRRTIVTTGAMALAAGMMLVYTALAEGVIAQMERNALILELGHVQLHHPDYSDDPNLYDRIEEPLPILEKLDAAGLALTPRLYAFVLAAAGTSSAGVQLRGVDLQREVQVTEVHKHLLAGRWLDAKDAKGVVIGKKLAKTLQVEVGDEIVVLGQASDGSMANDLLIVRGVLKSVGEGIDRAGVFIIDATFREIMLIETGVHEIAVLGEIGGDLDGYVSVAEEAAAGGRDNVSIKSWRDLSPILAALLDNSAASLAVMMLLTYTAVVMVVFNAMLMSVFERIREFGVLKAIGLSPLRVAAIIGIEAIAQVGIASVIAVAWGLPLALYLQAQGLDFSSFTSDISFGGVAMEPIWYARVSASSILSPIIFMAALSLLAVAYPAGKAALIRPVEAFRHH